MRNIEQVRERPALSPWRWARIAPGMAELAGLHAVMHDPRLHIIQVTMFVIDELIHSKLLVAGFK